MGHSDQRRLVTREGAEVSSVRLLPATPPRAETCLTPCLKHGCTQVTGQQDQHGGPRTGLSQASEEELAKVSPTDTHTHTAGSQGVGHLGKVMLTA